MKIKNIILEEMIKFREEQIELEEILDDSMAPEIKEKLLDMGPDEIDKEYSPMAFTIVKFGVDKVSKYLSHLAQWVDEGEYPHTDPAVAEYLHKNRIILDSMMPIPKYPKYFYRGMSNLKSYPKEGQKVRYSPKYPYSSWADNYHKIYCNKSYKKNSVLLKVKSDELIKKGEPFLWRFEIGFRDFIYGNLNITTVNPDEWAFKLIDTIDVEDWEYC